MKKFAKKQRYIAIGSASLLTLGVAGAAFAYFTSTGGGSGTVPTGHVTAVTIAQEGFGVTGGLIPAVMLLPGGPVQNINFTITNPGAGHAFVNAVTVAVAVQAVTLDTFAADGTTPNLGCKAAWFTVTQPTIGVSRDIAGSETSLVAASGLTVALANVSVSQNACADVAAVKLIYTSN